MSIECPSSVHRVSTECPSSVHGHVIAWPTVSHTLLPRPTHLPKECFGPGELDAVEALATTAQESNTTNASAPIYFTTVSSASDASFNRAADPRMMKMMRYMCPGLWEHNDEARFASMDSPLRKFCACACKRCCNTISLQLAGIASGPPLVEGAEEDERTAEEDATAAVEENARSSHVQCLSVRCLSVHPIGNPLSSLMPRSSLRSTWDALGILGV